ncbi:hypothetical protein Tco_0690127 [Tanacetum coccineum]
MLSLNSRTHTSDLIVRKYIALDRGPESIKNQESKRVQRRLSESKGNKMKMPPPRIKEVAVKVKDHKRKHDSDDEEDDDDDEGPSAGSNQGRSAKRRRTQSARFLILLGQLSLPSKNDHQSSKNHGTPHKKNSLVLLSEIPIIVVKEEALNTSKKAARILSGKQMLSVNKLTEKNSGDDNKETKPDPENI